MNLTKEELLNFELEDFKLQKFNIYKNEPRHKFYIEFSYLKKGKEIIVNFDCWEFTPNEYHNDYILTLKSHSLTKDNKIIKKTEEIMSFLKEKMKEVTDLNKFEIRTYTSYFDLIKSERNHKIWKVFSRYIFPLLIFIGFLIGFTLNTHYPFSFTLVYSVIFATFTYCVSVIIYNGFYYISGQ